MVTYVCRPAATQPSDGVDEVLLHLGAETHAGHQLLQQLSILNLEEKEQVSARDAGDQGLQLQT